MNEIFLKNFREKFMAALATKTGWGKNEVAQIFDKCSAEAAVEALDKAPVKPTR